MIKKITSPEERSEVCDKILRSLPKWFGIESSIVDYVKDVKSMETWVSYSNNELTGFISINKHNAATAEIHVIGVIEAFHKKGVGKLLIHEAEKYLVEQKFKYLTVKTLSELRADENYEKTRHFYLAMGFASVEVFKTLWGEHNPCLLMIKNIDSQPKNILLSHVEINVSDYSKSIRFYDTILMPLGWKRVVCTTDCATYSDGLMKFIISPTDSKYLLEGFHRKQVGLNHLAFSAKSMEEVNSFHKNILIRNSIECLYEKKPSGDDSYYAVFFEDPDRIKIELVYAPDYCKSHHWTNKIESNYEPFL